MTDTKNKKPDGLGRLCKAFDEMHEIIAFANYQLSKRDIREQLTPEQVFSFAQQANAATAALNALGVTLDSSMPRRQETLRIRVGEGEMRAAPDHD